MFGARGIHGKLEPMFRHLTRGILGYVGYNVLEPYWAFHVSYVSDEERRVTLGRPRQNLARLNSLPILSVPDLADYDGQRRGLRQEAGAERLEGHDAATW
jgi:NAD(P)H dehydrogenase (quinone)